MYHDVDDDDDEEGTTPFVMMPRWLLDETQMSSTALRLYLVLASYTDRRGRCYPAKSTLASRLDCTEQTVDLRLRELRDAGAVRVEARWRTDGGRCSNLYVLAWSTPFAADRPDSAVAPPGPPGGSQGASDPLRPATINPAAESGQATPAAAVAPSHPEPADVRVSPPVPPSRSRPPHLENQGDMNYNQRELDVSNPLTRATYAPSPSSAVVEHTVTSVAASRRPRPRNTLWDAVVEACGWSGAMTKAESGRMAAAVKQLRDVGATPDEVHRRAVAYRVTWPSTTLTPTALVANWSTLASSVERLREQRAVGDQLRGRGESAVDRVRRRMMGSEA